MYDFHMHVIPISPMELEYDATYLIADSWIFMFMPLEFAHEIYHIDEIFDYLISLHTKPSIFYKTYL